MFGFENLEVQVSVPCANQIYDTTTKFPVDERCGLTNQVRRAAVSISSNIAEGSGRGSNRDFIRFKQIAYGSFMETVSQIEIAKQREFLNGEDHRRLYEFANRLAKMLSCLGSSLDSSTPQR